MFSRISAEYSESKERVGTGTSQNWEKHEYLFLGEPRRERARKTQIDRWLPPASSPLALSLLFCFSFVLLVLFPPRVRFVTNVESGTLPTSIYYAIRHGVRGWETSENALLRKPPEHLLIGSHINMKCLYLTLACFHPPPQSPLSRSIFLILNYPRGNLFLTSTPYPSFFRTILNLLFAS